MDPKDFRIEIVIKDMDLCASKVNLLDDLRLRTRHTGIILWTAALGLALLETVLGLFILAVFLPLPFWILEARYRGYQRGWNLRLRAIRDFIRDGTYEVQGKHVATLQNFLDQDTDTVFPPIDFWARRTVSDEEHRKETSFMLNFASRTMVIIYAPMVLIAMVLGLIGVL